MYDIQDQLWERFCDNSLIQYPFYTTHNFEYELYVNNRFFISIYVRMTKVLY